VHLAKGCYTGQEALQRTITYQSVRRRLVRVSGMGATPAAPQRVASDAGDAGVLTSVTAAAEPDRWLGLAVLRLEACARGTARPLEPGGGVAAAEPFALPRPEGRPPA